MKILSAEEIRLWDQFTILNEPISSIDLMERAATACTDWLLKKYPDASSFGIFCGKGNNGGDGLAIARMLMEKGFLVTVYILEFGHKGTEDFQTNDPFAEGLVEVIEGLAPSANVQISKFKWSVFKGVEEDTRELVLHVVIEEGSDAAFNFWDKIGDAITEKSKAFSSEMHDQLLRHLSIDVSWT